MITNHTYSNLVLRPPSIKQTGFSPDEPAYRQLGSDMTEANGYANWASFQLYDTSGSVEDWSYWNTGGLGFTFEIGPDEFHPPFQNGVVAEYLGLPPADGAGYGGNREAYYVMAEATLDKALHSTIAGKAPRNRKLTVSKSFISATSPVIQTDGYAGAQRYYKDTLTSSYETEGGNFNWAVNPSTRPLVVGRYGRDPQGPPQPDQAVTNPAGTPAEGAYEETTFTVGGLPQYDNGTATVVIGWPDSDPRGDGSDRLGRRHLRLPRSSRRIRGHPGQPGGGHADRPAAGDVHDPDDQLRPRRGSSELDRSRGVRLPHPGLLLRPQGSVEPHLQQAKRQGDLHPGGRSRPRQDRPHRRPLHQEAPPLGK